MHMHIFFMKSKIYIKTLDALIKLQNARCNGKDKFTALL